MSYSANQAHPASLHDGLKPSADDTRVPDYLARHYWWAYVHPRGVKFFDRTWILNLILLGQYRRLREAVLEEFEGVHAQNLLQVSCVYGDLSCRLARRLAAAGGRIDVVDVLPIQLRNLRWKMPGRMPGRLLHMDSASLGLPDASYDAVLIFFLLHEQPAEYRARTLGEAMRVLRPGGKLVIVDYAKAAWWNPLRYLCRVIFALFEPYAFELLSCDFSAFLPPEMRFERHSYFGGFYQKVVAWKAPATH
jgi:ubiquinone/menaquinone biosynthesis C-methylase UbiE